MVSCFLLCRCRTQHSGMCFSNFHLPFATAWRRSWPIDSTKHLVFSPTSICPDITMLRNLIRSGGRRSSDLISRSLAVGGQQRDLCTVKACKITSRRRRTTSSYLSLELSYAGIVDQIEGNEAFVFSWIDFGESNWLTDFVILR